MLGLVLADNILVMFIFWELTSISSFMLNGHYHENERARQCARQALVVTVAGGLVLLAGLILLGLAAGSWRFSEILAGPSLAEHAHYPLILAFVAIGAFSKSAQFPFHFWLPNAMAAPAPVSALLHSATMVKAGVFLLARLHPTLGGTDAWFYLLAGVGSFTYHGFVHIMVFGVCAAFLTADLFHLFVAFEILLIASFALVVLKGGRAQFKGGLKYVVLNLFASLMFLSGIGLL